MTEQSECLPKQNVKFQVGCGVGDGMCSGMLSSRGCVLEDPERIAVFTDGYLLTYGAYLLPTNIQ